MILTFKIKYGKDFSNEPTKARQSQEFALKTNTLSSKDVKHFGLKSIMVNQLLRKVYKERYKENKVPKFNNTISGYSGR